MGYIRWETMPEYADCEHALVSVKFYSPPKDSNVGVAFCVEGVTEKFERHECGHITIPADMLMGLKEIAFPLYPAFTYIDLHVDAIGGSLDGFEYKAQFVIPWKRPGQYGKKGAET